VTATKRAMLTRLRSVVLRSRSILQSYFRLFEAAGLAFVFTAGALELLSIRDTDRHRTFYEMNVQGQILLDEITYRAFMQKETALYLKSPDSARLSEVITGRKDAIARLAEVVNHSLDTYQMIWTRAEFLNVQIAEFRKRIGLPLSPELERAQTNLAGLKAATENLRDDLKEKDGTIKFPITHLIASETMAQAAREETLAAALETIKELESRRSARSQFYFSLFFLGSLTLILGKYGNWLAENRRNTTQVMPRSGWQDYSS
jgi:hypothetical protein